MFSDETSGDIIRLDFGPVQQRQKVRDVGENTFDSKLAQSSLHPFNGVEIIGGSGVSDQFREQRIEVGVSRIASIAVGIGPNSGTTWSLKRGEGAPSWSGQAVLGHCFGIYPTLNRISPRSGQVILNEAEVK